MFSIESRHVTGPEIATLQEAQLYFRTEDSGGAENFLIENLVSTARSVIERMIDRSLVRSSVEVFASDWQGYLPFAPVKPGSIEISGIVAIQGNRHPYAVASTNTTINYETEAFQDPALKSAVLELAFYWYERGEFEGGQVPEKIKAVVKRFSRLTFIA